MRRRFVLLGHGPPHAVDMGKRGPKARRENVEWSADLAYAVGLIATDGGLSVDGRHLDLTSKDTEQLENFMHCIGKKVRISTKRASSRAAPVSRIQFSDVMLYDFFLSIGLTPRKSLTMGPLCVPDEFFFDFLRGHLDGDGCFYSYYDPRWRSSFMFYLVFLSASPTHVEWLRATLRRLLGVHGHMTHTGKGNGVWNLRFAKVEAEKVILHLYAHPSVVCLSRKRLKIQAALSIVGKSLPID